MARTFKNFSNKPKSVRIQILKLKKAANISGLQQNYPFKMGKKEYFLKKLKMKEYFSCYDQVNNEVYINLVKLLPWQTFTLTLSLVRNFLKISWLKVAKFLPTDKKFSKFFFNDFLSIKWLYKNLVTEKYFCRKTTFRSKITKKWSLSE